MKLANWRNTKHCAYFRGSKLKRVEYMQRLYECEEPYEISFSLNRLVEYRIAKWRARHKLRYFVSEGTEIHSKSKV